LASPSFSAVVPTARSVNRATQDRVEQGHGSGRVLGRGDDALVAQAEVDPRMRPPTVNSSGEVDRATGHLIQDERGLLTRR